MLKLVIVSPHPPWYSGGIERIVREVVKRLKRDFDIAIYCTDSKPGVYWWEDLPVHVFKGYTQAYRFSMSMYNALRKAECDLVHAHNFTTFMPLAASLTKKEVIINPHFHINGSTPSYKILRRIYDPLAGSYLFKNARLIVCNSITEKRLLSNRFRLNDKVQVVYNGVDVKNIKSAEPYNFSGKLILYLGRLERYKNVQSIIRAMEYLPKEYCLYIVGRGNYEINLRRLVAKLDLSKRVNFLGYLTDREVYRWLKTCSILIHLSEVESFGMTCVEALAAGKPIIVNDDNYGLKETAEMFKKYIYVVNVKEISAQRLAQLIEDKSEVEVCVSLVNFDWAVIARRFKELYVKVLEACPRIEFY